jgi:hypothetical protein
MRVLSRVGLRIAAPLLVLALSPIAHPQDPLKGNRGAPEGGGRTPGPKVVYVDRPGPAHDRIVRVLPKTGALTIVAESGASIRLQYLNRGGGVIKEYKGEGYTIGSGERSIIFKNLPPGKYQVVAELDGYRPATSPPVQVLAGKADKVDLILVPITYSITVRLNAGSGTLRYARGTEVSRSVPFQNSLAVLSGLTGGDYTVKIIPDDASYVPMNTTLRVPGDTDQVSLNLERLESRDFLGATASAWALPGGWSFSSGKVIVHGSGMALPSDVSYSHYKDFQLSTDVRMMNGIAASFAVHVVDPQNYYLVQITGPNADEPYVLRGFIVKNGVAQRFGRTIPTSQFSETLKPRKFFHVVLTMTDADITVRVQDSETGDLLKLGNLPDPSRTFRIGAVGIAAREGEQNEVSQFAICVSGCPNP